MAKSSANNRSTSKASKGVTKKAISKPSGPAWKTNWPRNGDLRAWFLCGIEKCAAIADSEEAASKAHLPIQALAELGHVKESLKHIDRFLRKLPADDVLKKVQMARLGAEICLNASDLPRMEKYLAIAAATEKFNTRKCDIGFSINSVRKFRAFHGILDLALAIGEEEKLEAIFKSARRRSKEFFQRGKRTEARAAAAEMEQAAKETTDEWRRETRFRAVIKHHAEIGDARAVQRAIKNLAKAERAKILDYSMLARLGMQKESIERAVKKVKDEVKELETMENPNIHFPVHSICDALLFLIEQRQRDVAARLYSKVARSAHKWPAIQGWTTSAVLTMFAEVAARLEGPKAAQYLLDSAERDARVESRPSFRKGAQSATIEMQARLNGLDEAIAKAKKLRSPTERRSELADLYASAGRWSELRAICQQVASPEEAASLVWSVKFKLPGGAAK
jgi:hypothetical protein